VVNGNVETFAVRAEQAVHSGLNGHLLRLFMACVLRLVIVA
jgi:hypothetical protein